VTLAVVGEITTVIPPSAGIVTVALADLVLSATEVAVTITGLCGACDGAVYVMAAPEALERAESEPQLDPWQAEPATHHVTPLFWASFRTDAVNGCA
jgi:hypothetical protein